MSELKELNTSPNQETVKKQISEKQKLENLESLIDGFRKDWKYKPNSFSRYKNYGTFSGYTEVEKAVIWDIYPNKTKIESGELKEVLKNILVGLYFFTEIVLELGIGQIDTDSTNLKMAKNLKNFCGCGNITAFERIRNSETGEIEKIPLDLKETDFAKLDESLKFENISKFIFKFNYQVDRELLEHLKSKIATFYHKEIKDLNQKSSSK